jgi:hypothetical protein
MISRFHGLDSFVRAWAAEINAGLQQAPGSGAMVRSMSALMRLVEMADRTAQEDQTLAALLRERFDTELRRIIEESPQTVLDIASTLGWRVSPPQC